MAGLTGKYEGIDKRLLDILNGVSQELGIPLQVNSGYRPGDSGQHGSRLAADIQISHLSDAQKAALVRKAHELGAARFITYDTSGHLHIDISGANGSFWPMHTPAGTGPKGGSNRHMGSAPQWYQNVVSQIQGAPRVDTRTASTNPIAGDPAINPHMLPSKAADMNGPDATFDPTALSDQQLIQLGILPSNPLAGQMAQPPTAQLPLSLGQTLMAAGTGMLNAGQNGNWFGAGLQAAQQSMLHQQELNRELSMASARSAAGGLPVNIQEILLLKRMYPNLSDEDILQMAFTGAIRGPGEELRQVGSVTVRRDRDQFGRPLDRPVDAGTQEVIEQRTQGVSQAGERGTQLGRVGELRQVGSATVRRDRDQEGRPLDRPVSAGTQEIIEQRTEDVSQAGERGTQLGRMEVETTTNVSAALNVAREALSATEDMLARFESGEFDNASGPIRGRVGQFLNPETAQLQRYEMDRALANLGIENLAPVSNYEIDLIRRMDASAFNTPGMNKAILRDIVRIRKAKVDALSRTLERLRTESIEEFIQKGPVAVELPPLESTYKSPGTYDRDAVVDELNRMGF